MEPARAAKTGRSTGGAGWQSGHPARQPPRIQTLLFTTALSRTPQPATAAQPTFVLVLEFCWRRLLLSLLLLLLKRGFVQREGRRAAPAATAHPVVPDRRPERPAGPRPLAHAALTAQAAR